LTVLRQYSAITITPSSGHSRYLSRVGNKSSKIHQLSPIYETLGN